MVKEKITFYFKTIIFVSVLFATQVSAVMTVLTDSILEETIGEGLQISTTGQIGIDIPDDFSIGFATGSGGTAGLVSLSNATLGDNCRIEFEFTHDTVAYNDPLKIDVKTSDGTEAGIADGTGYIDVDLPTMALKTTTFSVDLATDNTMADNDIQKLFRLSYSQGDISLFSGNIKIFAH